MRLFSVAVAATMASPVAPEVAHFFEHRGRAFRFHAKERVIRNLLFSAFRCGNNLSLYLSVIKYLDVLIHVPISSATRSYGDHERVELLLRHGEGCLLRAQRRTL